MPHDQLIILGMRMRMRIPYLVGVSQISGKASLDLSRISRGTTTHLVTKNIFLFES